MRITVTCVRSNYLNSMLWLGTNWAQKRHLRILLPLFLFVFKKFKSASNHWDYLQVNASEARVFHLLFLISEYFPNIEYLLDYVILHRVKLTKRKMRWPFCIYLIYTCSSYQTYIYIYIYIYIYLFCFVCFFRKQNTKIIYRKLQLTNHIMDLWRKVLRSQLSFRRKGTCRRP